MPIFLKRIEMQGFKSFATKTVINFESPITGVVGPNGCGKSNINDAIRWVLGEQSAKSLRGSNMTDVIFAGTSKLKPVNVAEVTLVFDNTTRFLQTDFDEVEITRRINRVDNSGEYLINNTPCRLKDIQDLVLDTGLGRESFGIITQGNISAFADAKPIDRRGFFEEAAGVAKYKKRKKDSLASLERTESNLQRLGDIVDEIYRQLEPLKRQAKKAQIYLSKKDELEKIEVGVLVTEIEEYNSKLNELDEKIRSFEADKLISQTQIINLEKEISDLRSEQRQLDLDINNLQTELVITTNNIQNFELQRVEIEERRKYQLENANNAEKIAIMKKAMDEAKYAYDNQNQLYIDLKDTINDLNNKYQDASNDISNLSNQLTKSAESLRILENKEQVLKSQLQSPYQYQSGVSAIVNAKDNLVGIENVVADAIKPHEDYDIAISNALGSSMYNIITTNQESASSAVNFLKKNRLGRVTFLPSNIITANYVNEQTLIIANETDGYLGTCDQFVNYEEKYENIVKNLLGNILLTDNLDNANELSNRIHHTYRIVTLDGDLVNKGGSITGGTIKNYYSPLTLQNDYNKTVSQLKLSRDTYEGIQDKYRDSSKSINDLSDMLLSKKIELAKMEASLNSLKKTYDSTRFDYERMNPDEVAEENNYSNELIENLNKAYSRKEEITTSINLKNERRYKNISESERKENQVRTIRRELSQKDAEDREMEMTKTRYSVQRDNSLARLNREYQLTFESASSLEFDHELLKSRDRVNILRNEINALGNVNLEAPEQYAQINERYTTLNGQLNELKVSRVKILAAINEMDEAMETQFMDTFNEINDKLPEVFVKLFGGGKAKLVLENPDDVLNSGVDVDIQPPGKAIQNIRLFSGGEKSLIAIAILFTILKIKPIPLCLFDEIESALDTNNIDRFANYLKEFSDLTQFIVVTHRTGTMAKCDVLYGVTMPQKGVTEMLKVKLQDAVELAENSEE